MSSPIPEHDENRASHQEKKVGLSFWGLAAAVAVGIFVAIGLLAIIAELTVRNKQPAISQADIEAQIATEREKFKDEVLAAVKKEVQPPTKPAGSEAEKPDLEIIKLRKELDEQKALAEKAKVDAAKAAEDAKMQAFANEVQELKKMLAEKTAPASVIIPAPAPTTIVGGNPLGLPLTNAVTGTGPGPRSFDANMVDDKSIVDGLTRLSRQTKDSVAIAAMQKAAVAISKGQKLDMNTINVLKAISLGMAKVGFNKDAAIVEAATEAVLPPFLISK